MKGPNLKWITEKRQTNPDVTSNSWDLFKILFVNLVMLCFFSGAKFVSMCFYMYVVYNGYVYIYIYT